MRHSAALLTVSAAFATGLAAAALAVDTSPLEAQTLRGSPASVDLMYSRAHENALLFLRTPSDIYAAAQSGALKLMSFNDDLELGAVKYPFVLPNTLRFADSLAAAYHAGCGERIVVTSGARPIDEQPRNASPKSVHPTGMAVDFRKPRTPACLQWMRTNLVTLEDRHVIEATEEEHPPHFHVAVLRQFAEPKFAMAAGDIAVPKKLAATNSARRKTQHAKQTKRSSGTNRAAEDR